MNELSKRLKQAIKESGKSHRELEAITGIPHSAIQRYAAGATDNIPIARLKILAEALGTTASALLGWEEQNEEWQKRRNEDMIRLFAQLDVTEQDIIIAQIQGILAKHDKKDSGKAPE